MFAIRTSRRSDLFGPMGVSGGWKKSHRLWMGQRSDLLETSLVVPFGAFPRPLMGISSTRTRNIEKQDGKSHIPLTIVCVDMVNNHARCM